MQANNYSDSRTVAPAHEFLAGKYLTFKLAKEEYGIGILKIREIIGMMPVTALPQTPPFVKGVINLRGKVIPVTDLRAKFCLEDNDYTDRTCIVVVEVNSGSGAVTMGLVVDAVSEVATIKGDTIESTPSFGTHLHTDYILGIAKAEGGVKILLDIDRVLTTEELDQVTEDQVGRESKAHPAFRCVNYATWPPSSRDRENAARNKGAKVAKQELGQ